MKRFLLLFLLTPAALGATYNVALPGGGVLTVNGLPYVNPGITNSASVVWGVDGTGLLYATATGTNSSIVYVEGAAVAGPNFGLSTEIDPAVTASTNITFLLVNSSITTNKIDSTFYALLMQTGAGDVTQAGNNTFTGTNIFQSATTISNLTVDALEANSLTLNTPIGVAAVGTNAADARTQLGVAYDVDVQAYRLQLLQAALALTADGHMVYHNGTLVTNLLSTSPGRYLLTAATATDQRNSLVVGELDQTVYSAAWDGVTNKTPTLDSIYDWGQALPGGSNAITTWNPNYFSVSGGYLDWIGGSVGGGSGGYTYLATNVGGAFQSRADGTNWAILSTTISSNNAPAGAGRFLDGGFGLVITNNSGTSANISLNVIANGTTVFRDTAGVGTGITRAFNSQFWLVRETDTTAAFLSVGGLWGSPSIGYGDFGGTTLGASVLATNISWNWSTNSTLNIELQCDTSTSTNSALGMRLAHSYLRAEGAGFSDGTDDGVAGGSTGVEGVAITNINFRSSYAARASVTAVTNVDWLPQPPTTTSATSLTPAFGSSRAHEFTLTGAATLNAPSGITSDMVGDTFRLVFIQDSTGNRTLTVATNYLFGTDITGITLTTNSGARDYAVVYVRRTNALDVVGFVRGYAQ